MQSSILSVKNLVKSFGKKIVLKGISFDVKSNSVTGFLGPNGAGKTTTIKTILGFLNSDDGSIEILGENRRSSYVMGRIGYVSEAPQFYPYLKGREILELTGKLLKIESNKLKEEIENLSNIFNLGNFLESKVYTYSFGTFKKLAFAQSMIGDPELLIYDEPYNGLDPIMINKVRETILELKRKDKTIFVSSHLLSEMERVCDEVIFINNGNIILSGNIKELKEKCRIVSAINSDAKLRNILWEKKGIKIEEKLQLISEIDNSYWSDLMNEEPFISAISSEKIPTLEDIFLDIAKED